MSNVEVSEISRAMNKCVMEDNLTGVRILAILIPEEDLKFYWEHAVWQNRVKTAEFLRGLLLKRCIK